jgi:hypothetical protein
VEKLADIIRKRLVVALDFARSGQAGGSKPPFFCVHGGGGNVLVYRELARHLGADYPFMAFNPGS